MSSPGRLGPPAPSRPVVARPRLLSALHGRFQRRLTALVAGPGFGKSTLLGQAVLENELSPRGQDVWLGCTADDAAVSVLAAGLLGPFESPQDTPADPRQAAQTVADAVWSRAPQQIALVLDDVHALPPDSPGQVLLTALLEALPANGHLVLASRPPLHLRLSRLLATGEALILEEEDLAFAAAELSAFAVQRQVPEDVLADVGGWPALAELAATAGRHHVVDYLWEEVLDRIGAERRDLLATLVAIGGADDALATEVRGTPTDLRALLHDLPLVSSTREGWWSLHPLWQAALNPQTMESPAAAAARRRAGAALRRRGRATDSMRLLLEAEAWDDVCTLVVEVCSGLTPAVPADVLARWHDRLPPELRGIPEGLLLSGTAIKGEDPWTAQPSLQQAADGFRAAGRTSAELGTLQSLFQIAFWLNDMTEIERILGRWEEIARAGDTDAVALGGLGRALLTPDPALAQREIEEVPRALSGPLAPIAEWMRAHVLLLTLGDVDQAATWARHSLPHASPTLRSSVRCELVELLRLSGDADAAEEQVTALLEDLEHSVVRSPRHLVAAIVLHAFLGRTGDAERLLPSLRSAVTASHLPWAPIAGAIGEAACAVATGDEPRGAEFVRSALEHRMSRPRVLLRVSPAALPLSYLLVPNVRADWDASDLRGTFLTTHRLVRALVAIREGSGDLPTLPAADLALARTHLPVPWSTELGVGLAARGVGDGLTLVEDLGSPARPTLRRLEETSRRQVSQVARRLLAHIPATPRHHLELCVLGPLAVLRDGEEVDDPDIRRERVRQLLGQLVVHRRLPRSTAAATLWPDLEVAVAARNLRVTLNYLQRVLEPDRDERDAPYFLRTRGTTLELTDDPALEVDAWAFERYLRDAERAEHQGAPSVALDAYLRATDRYRGELLADLPPDDWLMPERDRLGRRFVAAALRAGNLLLARGDHDQPERLATRALAAEPWSEPAYQLLVATALARHDRAAARRALDRCFLMLEDLETTASPETLALAEQLRRGARTPSADV